MNVSETGCELIEGFEGYSFKAYWDPYGRVWTVGYGETQGVTSSTTQTRAQAEADLRSRLEREYEPAINTIGGQHWNQNQYDAWCSVVWNLGTGATKWDIGRYAQEGKWQECANALLAYDRAGGVVLGGLVTRRHEEAALMLKAPPPPPDPLHHAWFPDAAWQFDAASIEIQGKTYSAGAQRWNERTTVVSYDTLRPHPSQGNNSTELNHLRIGLMVLRNRCNTVAHWSTPVAWNDSRRLGWRWQELNDRMNGQLVKP